MRTTLRLIVPMIACLGGCASLSKPLPLPELPIQTGGECYLGGHLQTPGVYQISDPPQTLAQVILTASSYKKLEPRTNIDLIRRVHDRRETFHKFHWYQLEHNQDWIVHADDQIMVGTNEGSNCFGITRSIACDHREQPKK